MTGRLPCYAESNMVMLGTTQGGGEDERTDDEFDERLARRFLYSAVALIMIALVFFLADTRVFWKDILYIAFGVVLVTGISRILNARRWVDQKTVTTQQDSRDRTLSEVVEDYRRGVVTDVMLARYPKEEAEQIKAEASRRNAEGVPVKYQ